MLLLYELQGTANLKKIKSSDVRHGCKYAYFWKIQKEVPSDPPWASKSQKAKDFNGPKINGSSFKKVVKRSILGRFYQKRKPSEVRHGRKNEYFLKIQKGGPSGTPWASKSKKAKDLDRPKINGAVFNKVGHKKVKNWPGGVKFGIFEKRKKVPLDNVPRVPCSKFQSSTCSRK